MKVGDEATPPHPPPNRQSYSDLSVDAAKSEVGCTRLALRATAVTRVRAFSAVNNCNVQGSLGMRWNKRMNYGGTLMRVYTTELRNNWATLESAKQHEREARIILRSKAQLRIKKVRALAS